MKKYYTVAILTVVLVCLSQSLFAQGLTDDPRATGVPIESLLKPDGTLDLATGYTGSLDVSGFRMETGRDGRPRFLPDMAGQSAPSRDGSMDLQSTLSDDDQFWASGFEVAVGITGEVLSLAVMGNDLYVGGHFKIGGETDANNIAMWDGENWSALGSGISGDDYVAVYALAVMGDTLYAGGNFNRAGGVDASYIAKWDGETWSDLDWGMNDWVFALTVMGSDLYAGGWFTIAGEAQANGIAKWDGNNWSVVGDWMGWGTYALAVSGSNLYAGGQHGMSIWNGSYWSAFEWQIDGTVYAFAVNGNQLYIGGDFIIQTPEGPAFNIARIVRGRPPSPLGSGLDYGAVYSLAVMDDVLYAGAYYGIGKWDGREWSTLGGVHGHDFRALAVSGSNLYAAGRFGFPVVTNIDFVAKWDGESWAALFDTESVYGGFDSRVSALAVMGNDLYAGGRFTNAGGIDVNRIAKWDGENWSALGTGIAGGIEPTVSALAVMGNDLYVGGRFTKAGEIDVNHIAKWSADGGWSALGEGVNDAVSALAAIGSDLYAGGWFTTAGGTTANGIAKWSADGGWSALGEGVTAHTWGVGNVRALAANGSYLYVGGDFRTAGETDVNNIAKWSAEGGWSALGSGVVSNWGGEEPWMGAYVTALAVIGSDLYVGGEFAIAGSTPANNIAKWSAEVGWSALGSGMDGYWPKVNALAVMGNDLYAGGRFTNAGEVDVNRIAKWDGESWSALGSGMNGGVSALAVTGGDLYVGGYFTIAGGKSSGHIARWFKPVAAAAVTRTFTTPQAEPLSFNEQDAVTGVSLQIKSGSGGPTVHILRYEDAPKDPTGIAQNASPFRWIIQQSGIAPNFNATLRFKLSDIPNHGITDPSPVIVYRRTTLGTGIFNMHTTSYDPANDELVIGDVSEFGEFAIGNISVDAEDQKDGLEVPAEYRLSQNYPNPFNPATTIGFSMPQPGMVTLEVYNMLGQKVATLVSGELQAGRHSYYWDATGLASGVYLYRLTAGDYSRANKMMLMK